MERRPALEATMNHENRTLIRVIDNDLARKAERRVNVLMGDKVPPAVNGLKIMSSYAGERRFLGGIYDEKNYLAYSGYGI